MDEHNDYSEYINQLPDAESPTHDTSDVNNNIDQHADQVGAAVADRLGPLLGAAAQGITDRLDVLNKIAARLLLQAQQPTSTAGTASTAGAGVPPRVGLASRYEGSTASGASGAGAATADAGQPASGNGSNGAGTGRRPGAPLAPGASTGARARSTSTSAGRPRRSCGGRSAATARKRTGSTSAANPDARTGPSSARSASRAEPRWAWRSWRRSWAGCRTSGR